MIGNIGNTDMEKTWVVFSAPTWQLTTIYTFSYKRFDVLHLPLRLLDIQECTDIHAGTPPIHTKCTIKNTSGWRDVVESLKALAGLPQYLGLISSINMVVNDHTSNSTSRRFWLPRTIIYLVHRHVNRQKQVPTWNKNKYLKING